MQFHFLGTKGLGKAQFVQARQQGTRSGHMLMLAWKKITQTSVVQEGHLLKRIQLVTLCEQKRYTSSVKMFFRLPPQVSC